MLPICPAAAEPEPGETGHQIKLRGPHEPVRRNVSDETALYLHPVMRPSDLADQIVVP